MDSTTMQDKYIQSVRYKLQKRVRKVHSAEPTQFLPVLKHFLQFIQSTPLLAGVRDELLARTQSLDVDTTVDKIIRGEPLSAETEEEAAAIGYKVLNRLAADAEGSVVM